MDSSTIGLLLLQVLLIALNAIFACAEIAVISMNDNKLAKLAAEGDKRAIRLQKLTSQPARFLSTIQVAITLSGFLGSAFAAENFSDGLVDWLIGLGVKVPAATLDAIAVVAITVILSYFTLIFGELVPKRVAQAKAEQLALGISGLICTIAAISRPIVWLLTVSTNGILRLLRIDVKSVEHLRCVSRLLKRLAREERTAFKAHVIPLFPIGRQRRRQLLLRIAAEVRLEHQLLLLLHKAKAHRARTLDIHLRQAL